MSAFENVDVKNTSGEVEYIKIGNTNFEVASFYNGNMTLIDVIKNALKRDAEMVSRQMNNN
jgi:hypothetical protein